MSNDIRLPSGFLFDLETFDLSRMTIRDLAHNLSKEPRFSGGGMSVAAHSVLVLWRTQQLLTPGHWLNIRRWALLHDAVEGLGLRDMASPIKQMPELEGYRLLEHRWMAKVAERFGLEGERPEVVRQADWEVGRTEQVELFGKFTTQDKWADVEPLDQLLPRWDWRESRLRFEDEAERLGLR